MTTISNQIYRDQQDLVRWIENKLGSNELWGGRQASFMLSHDILVELETCFQELEPHVKLKIIQAIIHLSPKTIETLKIPLCNLLEVARRDPDDWVETIADIYRQFPDFGYIQCSSKQDSYFTKTQLELEKIIGNKVEACSINTHGFPDYEYLAPAVLDAISIRNILTSNTIQYFSKRQKITKSTKMLEDMRKAYEQQNNPSFKRSHGLTSSFPIKIRSTAKKLNNNLPMKGIQSSNPLKMACGFTNESKKYQQRTLIKRTGGAMLIDIAELPQKPNNRRKRNVETNKVSNEAVESNTKQPIATELNKIKHELICEQTSNNNSDQFIQVNGSKIVNDAYDRQSNFTINCTQNISSEIHPTNMHFNNQSCSSILNSSDDMNLSNGDNNDNANILAFQHESLLRDANKLTQMSHNLIISFLNGNKNNPLEDKLGSLVTLPFSESIEFEKTANGVSATLVEVFFQMDYSNGEWKRLRKTRLLKSEELNQYQYLLTKKESELNMHLPISNYKDGGHGSEGNIIQRGYGNSETIDQMAYYDQCTQNFVQNPH